jgi:ceramide glucosyltransferase
MVVTLAQALLLLAGVGLLSCTVFLGLTVVAVLRFRRRKQYLKSSDSSLPPVTLLKPLCGIEPNLEANLESFLRQDYPNFEIIFGTRDANDPALDVAMSVCNRHPGIKVKVVFSGEPDRPNAKVCSLEKMYAAASHDYLVISDSDVGVQPNYLREIVGPLLNPQVGMVTCVYRGVPTGGIWSQLEALGMSVEMTSGVIVADMLEGMRFALGPTMAIRRQVLDAVGGFGVLANYCADDYVLGHLVHASGHSVSLSRHVIEHFVIDRSLKASLQHQARWMKSTRFSRPKGHIGSGLTFAMPFGLLAGLAGFWAQRPLLGGALLAWAVLNRIIISIAVGWGVVRDRRALRYCWLYPIHDFLGFCFWCASFLSRTIVWRGEQYRLELGGTMVRTGTPRTEKPSGAVAIDDLA